MKLNMGKVDRSIRILIAIIASVLYFTETVSGVWGIVLLAIGAIMLLTSIVGFCPLYTIFGWKTCPSKASRKN